MFKIQRRNWMSAFLKLQTKNRKKTYFEENLGRTASKKVIRLKIERAHFSKVKISKTTTNKNRTITLFM